MKQKDYHEILGVDSTATVNEIRSQYRRLARKYHPDVSSEHNAEAKFKEMKEACEFLTGTGKTRWYGD